MKTAKNKHKQAKIQKNVKKVEKILHCVIINLPEKGQKDFT